MSECGFIVLVLFIGPPTAVSNLKSVVVEIELLKRTVLTWDPPNSYGANLKNYMIQFMYVYIIKNNNIHQYSWGGGRLEIFCGQPTFPQLTYIQNTPHNIVIINISIYIHQWNLSLLWTPLG